PSHFDGNQIAVTIPRGKDGTDRTLTLSLETGLDQQGVLLNTVKLLAATIDRKLDDGRRLLPSAD
ncbi:hypothetical protein WJ63_19380, partial [Burkholderia pyrrocinia]